MKPERHQKRVVGARVSAAGPGAGTRPGRTSPWLAWPWHARPPGVQTIASTAVRRQPHARAAPGAVRERRARRAAQSVAPQARVVYVDHDPIVLCHARALLISVPEGRTDFIEADLRQPLAILSEAARTLDFGRPERADGAAGHPARPCAGGPVLRPA